MGNRCVVTRDGIDDADGECAGVYLHSLGDAEDVAAICAVARWRRYRGFGREDGDAYAAARFCQLACALQDACCTPGLGVGVVCDAGAESPGFLDHGIYRLDAQWRIKCDVRGDGGRTVMTLFHPSMLDTDTMRVRVGQILRDGARDGEDADAVTDAWLASYSGDDGWKSLRRLSKMINRMRYITIIAGRASLPP